MLKLEDEMLRRRDEGAEEWNEDDEVNRVIGAVVRPSGRDT